MRKLRVALWLAVALALFALGALGMGWLGARDSGSVQAGGGLAPGGPLGGAFTLVDGSGGLRIGRGCDISSGVQIYTHSSIRRCVSGGAYTEVDRAPVVIGDRVFLGANAVVLMGVTIGEGAVVGDGAVVERSVVWPGSAVAPGERLVGAVRAGPLTVLVRP